MIERVINQLKELHADLSQKVLFSSTQEKAEHLGMLNTIDLSIQRLAIYERNGIYPSDWLSTLPDIVRGEYRAVADSGDWEESNFQESANFTYVGENLAVA